MRFVLSDQSLNSYGFRVLTLGILLEAFRKNPVMLYMHDRQLMPIGRWDDIKIEGDKLTAEAVFDTEDPVALAVASKVNQGILNAVSIGFRVIELSEDPKYLLPGQTRPTVTKCEVYECSIVDIPGNKNALKLSDPGELITLSGEIKGELLDTIIPKLKPNMEKLALALGLAATATESEILQKLNALQAVPPVVAPAAAPAAPAVPATPLVESLLALGRERGVVNDDNTAHWAKLAAADFNSALALLTVKPAEADPSTTAAPAAAAPHQTLAAAIAALAGHGGGEGGEKKLTFKELERENPKALEKLRLDKPAEFQRLFNESYGKKTA